MTEVEGIIPRGLVLTITIMVLSWPNADGGICFTKSGPPSICYSDDSYFASSSGLRCCLHADAVGFTATDQPAYEFSLRTYAHYTRCQPCSSLLEKGYVICFTKATNNGCSNTLQLRVRSPRTCCQDNRGGGFSEELVLNQGDSFTVQYKCTPCTIMAPTRVSGWAEWSTSSSCSSTCGQGQKIRHRDCLTPPQNGGCVGVDTDVIRCILEPCNDSNAEGTKTGWSEWSMVSLCNSTCGPGFLRRRRHCLQNIGIHQSNSKDDVCLGNDYEEVQCQLRACFTYKQLANRPALILVCVATGFMIVASVGVTLYWRKRKCRYLRPEQACILGGARNRTGRASRSSRSHISVQPVDFPEADFVLTEVNNVHADMFHYDNPSHMQDEEEVVGAAT